VSLDFFIDHIYYYGDALRSFLSAPTGAQVGINAHALAVDVGVVTTCMATIRADRARLRSLRSATTRLSRSGTPNGA